ncbi:MAG: molybdopterin cofactor-binding domain-containing protein [Piscinibacter sp.]|uniref:xanthine dehydrogenase family protein molybdopterin-binding subunit n=1 Tax=Piscinibacter sp. TaxID=1903157 RepID=UPI003D117721
MSALRRRTLLAGGAATVLLTATGCSLLPPIPKRPQPTLAHAIGWLRFDDAGRVELFCPRMEMGQGIHAALRALVARELGVPPSAVRVRHPSTNDIPPAKATVGSDSVRELVPLLREACAMLRERMPRDTPGAVGDDADPALRDLVTGAPVFTADVRLPGLRHACVLRSPWRRETGSVLLGLDEAALQRVPGFLRRIDLPQLDGPALVADHPGALQALRDAARPRWHAPEGLPDALTAVDVDRALARGHMTKDRGAVADGPWTLDLRLDVPSAAHAGLEPRCAVARFAQDGALEVWCGTQDPFFVRDVLARDHGLPPERVTVHAMRIGGAFGGRTIATVEREVAWVAKAIGTPVKLQWNRDDEFSGGFHRPPASHRIRARLDERGQITDWWHVLSGSHVLFTNAAVPPWMQRLTDLIGDDGTARGQHPPYAFTRQRRSLVLTRLPIATGPWRGLGAGPNVLAIEAAMDEAARRAGADPVDFRLRHLAHAPAGEHLLQPERLAAVLRRAAARAAAVPLPGGHARGVACGVYKGRSVAAAVAEVLLEDDAIRVTRLWCSHDCGAMVDADGVRAQVEGNLVWSIGLVLGDDLPTAGGRVTVASFGDYALPRMAQMPHFDIDLVESGEPPSGAGETAIVAGAGAIFNAIAAASGTLPMRLPVRRRELPNPR